MIVEVSVPDIGEFKNIPIIEILVGPGDKVIADSTILVLESDKATLDVPSPRTGIVRELKVAVGDRVSLGTCILSLDVADGSTSESPLAPAPTASEPATGVADRESSASWSPRLVGDSAIGAIDGRDVASDKRRPPGGSPSVRRFARELGVDLAVVRGSGPRGRILKADLQAFIKSAMSTSEPNHAAGPKLAPWPKIDFSTFGKIDRTSLTQIQKVSGENLGRNWAVIPHVTNFEDADITELEAFRNKVNADGGGLTAKITLLSFVIKAVTVSLKLFPRFNSSLDGQELVLKRYFHIGFAADTPNGLVVPVIRDAETKGISEIANEAAALASLAREGKLKLADMQGGCFTISSLGGVGGTGFTPIINAPEVAILGLTRARIRPVWDGKSFQPRLILPLSLSWDHRVVDGVAAGRFLNQLSTLLADFRRVSM